MISGDIQKTLSVDTLYTDNYHDYSNKVSREYCSYMCTKSWCLNDFTPLQQLISEFSKGNLSWNITWQLCIQWMVHNTFFVIQKPLIL